MGFHDSDGLGPSTNTAGQPSVSIGGGVCSDRTHIRKVSDASESLSTRIIETGDDFIEAEEKAQKIMRRNPLRTRGRKKEEFRKDVAGDPSWPARRRRSSCFARMES
jgi:hypothetical protein